MNKPKLKADCLFPLKIIMYPLKLSDKTECSNVFVFL